MERILHILRRVPALMDSWKDVLAHLRDRVAGASERLAKSADCIRQTLVAPSWLSAKVPSVWVISARASRGEHVGFGEQFHRQMHRFHSIRASLTIFLVLLFSIFLIAVIFRDESAKPQSPDQVAAVAGTVGTVAQVLGGVAGLLFAVIVFGIQFHGERLGQASFLVRYLGRREGLMPIAAITLAVVGANTLAAVIGVIGFPGIATTVATLDIVVVPIVLAGR